MRDHETLAGWLAGLEGALPATARYTTFVRTLASGPGTLEQYTTVVALPDSALSLGLAWPDRYDRMASHSPIPSTGPLLWVPATQPDQ
jgi:hypothetical protein